MSAFYCNRCKSIFVSPAMTSSSFSHGFGVEEEFAEVCPLCGSPDFDDAVPCANTTCNVGYMRSGEHLCPACRYDLKKRVIAFFDSFTAEEEAQFDAWIDGETITNRRKFE